MSDPNQWRCPECGTGNGATGAECPCGYCPIPLELHLVSEEETSVIAMRISTPIGRRLLKRIVREEDIRYAAEEQFILTKDPLQGNWIIKNASSATNPTYVNGAPLKSEGAALKPLDVITIGKSRCRIKVSFP